MVPEFLCSSSLDYLHSNDRPSRNSNPVSLIETYDFGSCKDFDTPPVDTRVMVTPSLLLCSS